ncbi:hypothetical protein ASE80_18125 [Pseudomonas sp. Leaf15]|uniref:hypothetical protein n=1 Tax=unclassified Pseudomonas TaxID=196821 RepID=UPI000703BC69|nr:MULTISPECIES: hypothetical protein [unclassified Pseudomonas]KQM46134.1 hypothetical protein ASE80_18125 [Pseudomonas sp. Leaf15]RAH00446.1 hypothetical protein DJ480_22910 [Pseudomonas sp. Leaf98]
MMFSNAAARPVVFTKIGDFFSGGFTRTETPRPIRTGEAPKVEGPGGSKPADGSNNNFDQGFVDKKVGFDGPGQATGHRQPGDGPEAPVTPEVAQHREANRKKWQAQKDAGARDKLFEQPTAGRVDGKEVEPFSQSKLEESAQAVVNPKAAKADRALPLEKKNIAKVAAITAAITVPLTVAGTFAANVFLEYLKPKINPAKTPATEQHVLESRLVDESQRRVFLLANTLGSLRTEFGVNPSIEWLAKTNEERMDYLDEMVDFLEVEFAKEAQKLNIKVEAPKPGAQKDDIKSRAIGMESRMAYITELIKAIKAKQ